MKELEFVGVKAWENEELEYPKMNKKKRFYLFMWIYVLSGIAGTIYETILTLVLHQRFEYRSGCILGIVNFVYGMGGLVICIIFCAKKWKVWQIYLMGAFFGGFFEMTLSYLEEAILGTRSWDYSNRFLNIAGRTTLPYMLFWGLLCGLCVYGLYPLVHYLVDKLWGQAFKIVSIILFIVMGLDYTLSIMCIIRQNLRAEGLDAKILGTFIDNLFSEDYILKRYPKMKF